MQHVVPPFTLIIQVPPEYSAARNVPCRKYFLATVYDLAPTLISLTPICSDLGELRPTVLAIGFELPICQWCPTYIGCRRAVAIVFGRLKP